jgi:hypothetical protein
MIPRLQFLGSTVGTKDSQFCPWRKLPTRDVAVMIVLSKPALGQWHESEVAAET